MKLLIVLPSWIPGGADRTYIAPIVPQALRRGWEVHTCCSSRSELSPLVAQLTEAGANHHPCEIAESHCARIWYRTQQFLFFRRMHTLLLAISPHRVLLALPWYSHGLGIMRACRAQGVPVATVFQLVRRENLPRWRRTATHSLLTSTCHPVAVSENNRTIICSMFHLHREQVSLIYNGTCLTPRYSASQRDTIRSRCRKSLGIDDNQLMLLTTARLDRQKGHRFLIEITPSFVSTHPNAVFVFVGDGKDRSEIETLVAKYGVEGHVVFLGHRTDVEKLSLAADLFVFPTTFEGSPFGLLEAMALGLPVVTTDASGIPEVVRDDEDGIVVEKENPRALLEGLLKAASDMPRMQEMARSAGERVKAFSGQRMAEQTLDLLEALPVAG